MSPDNRVFRRALELSVLLHLLLIFVVAPRAERLWPVSSEAARQLVPRQPADEQKPLRFELVDLAEDREEEPVSPDVPLSDLDRRAHGGEGEAADRAQTRGNTPQIIQAEGGQVLASGSPPRLPGPDSQPVPPPQPEEPRPDDQESDEPRQELAPEGAGETREEPAQAKPRITLPPPGSWALPPEQGGLLENPDRRGGQVDPSGLSFDTQWYDWGPYAKAMLAKIRRNWRIPEIARLGVQGVAKIRFFIERDGTVTGLQIVDESGKPPMDFAARDAIAHSSPFDPLPSDLSGVDREGVTITFFYNTRPPDMDGR